MFCIVLIWNLKKFKLNCFSKRQIKGYSLIPQSSFECLPNMKGLKICLLINSHLKCDNDNCFTPMSLRIYGIIESFYHNQTFFPSIKPWYVLSYLHVCIFIAFYNFIWCQMTHFRGQITHVLWAEDRIKTSVNQV